MLTAGLYANPIVYADKQLIGYQPYSLANNPGGPAQYDVNVAYPFDVSGKRQARIEVASAAQRVVEALYQDAVRLEVDRLNDAFVDALSCAAQLADRSRRAGFGGRGAAPRGGREARRSDSRRPAAPLATAAADVGAGAIRRRGGLAQLAAHLGVAIGSAP